MAVEALLPSEIARLVYGYLIEEKCTNTAKSFLNESPNLEECRNILRCGKTFTTHLRGLRLMDILEKYCTVNCLVQDQLAVFDSTHKLRICNDIVIQIKFLLQAASSRSEHVQSDHEEPSTSTSTSSKVYKKRHSNKNENESNVAAQSDDGYQTETPPDSNSIQNIPSVEATPLEHLPGYSQPVAVKTPTKITNKSTPSQQSRENVISQAVQTSISETQKICEATDAKKQVQSEEAQTSVEIADGNKLLVPKPMTNSQKVQIENAKTPEENVNRLNTLVESKLSNVTDPKSGTSKTNLCNNLGYGDGNQEVINLDDSGDQRSLGSPTVEEVEMDIDNDNPSSEGNISSENVLIVEEKNQCDPELVSVKDTKASPVLQNAVIPTQNTIILNSADGDMAQKFTKSAPSNIPNNAEMHEKCLVNSMEPSLFEKNFPNPPDLSDHNTSTPLKLFTATQNYENNEWFSTETLPSSNIVPLKEAASATANGDCPFVQTATENIVSPVDGFISPIICKENTKVAEKISLNCPAAKIDDTLHTPDVPPVIKSFIPTMPPPVLILTAPLKDKTPVLPKNPDGENVQTVPETSPGFISISSLVKNTEFNRYFSIDSITVSQMENTVSTLQNPSTLPVIQVEESVGFTGTDLSDKIEETQVLLRLKVDEANAKASEAGIKNSVETEVNGGDCEMQVIEEVTPLPVINPPAQEITAQAGINEPKEPEAVILLTNEMDDGVNVNEDVTSAVQEIEKKSVDSTSQDPNEANDKVNNKTEEDIEMELEAEIGGIIETSEYKKPEGENIASNTAVKDALISNETVNAIPVESKVQNPSANKPSLKSFISKTFESYIDPSKATSNHNNDIATRNTPKALVEERTKNQRRSLSTPKKTSSHIRALTFETPIQSKSDSKISGTTRCASPESAKRNLKRLHESFQSPPVVSDDFDIQVKGAEEALAVANGVNGKMTDTVDQSSQDKDMKKENAKKSWDSDLRMLCQPSEPKVEPKRRYKTKSKEEGSNKKKKRDKSKTPRKEKKSDKSPHKKSKKSEKEKTPKKSKNRDKSRDSDGKDTKSKTKDKLTAKDCQDLGALIESNLMLSSEVENKDEAKKKTVEEEFKDISAQIENNLLSSKNSKVISRVEVKSKAEEKLSAKEYKDISAKIENNLMSIENETVEDNVKVNSSSNEKILPVNENKVDERLNAKQVSTKLNSNSNQRPTMEGKQTEPNKTGTSTQLENEGCPPTATAKPGKKDPLEYLLSDSVNEDESFNDIMELGSGDIAYHDQLTEVNKPIDTDIAEKMQQDELAMSAVLEEANHAVNEKYKSLDAVAQQDFFPETSLMTEGDESDEENEEQKETASLKNDSSKNPVDEKLGGVSNLQPEKEIHGSSQANEKQSESEQTVDKTLDTSSKSEVDYDSIEQQLSILTNTEVSSARKVIYDQVSKLEDGKVVKRKYARLKTLDTKVATDSKSKPPSGYKKILNSASPIKEDESLQMPPTPQIGDPGSNSWIPNPVIIKEDSRTIHSSIPTPLECPPTPKIFITPQKVEEEAVHVALKEVETHPAYHLTPITFEDTKKPEVTEFEVVKETLKKTTPKTPSEEKSGESTTEKTSNPVSSSCKENSSSHLDSEDSDSSSSSDSSDSSSSSSSDDDDDDCSMQAPELAKAKEDPVEAKPNPENKLELLVQNEVAVAGNEIMCIEHEEVVVAQEASPTKVFSIHKTDEQLADIIKETPAKDENMIPEEGIFETPNVSKPVDNPTNLHAKISEMMILKEQEEIRRLESQQKPKIINVERMSPKFVMKNFTQQTILPPADVATTVLQKDQIKTNIVKKSEAEVAKAIESIANEKFDESQDELNASGPSSVTPEIPTDKVKKRELSKAIQSITNNDEDEDSSGSSSDDDSSSDSEANLKLVLEDDVKSQQNGESSSDESMGFTNSETHNTEIHVIFDEKNYKKRRRTEYFTDEQLKMPLEVEDEDGSKMLEFLPSCLYMLFNIDPPKKKAGPKKQIKKEVKVKEEEEYDDGDSSEDFVPARNARGGAKRRRSDDEPKSRKRKKNVFIY